jgi:hypothetical protein
VFSFLKWGAFLKNFSDWKTINQKEIERPKNLIFSFGLIPEKFIGKRIPSKLRKLNSLSL